MLWLSVVRLPMSVRFNLKPQLENKRHCTIFHSISCPRHTLVCLRAGTSASDSSCMIRHSVVDFGKVSCAGCIYMISCLVFKMACRHARILRDLGFFRFFSHWRWQRWWLAFTGDFLCLLLCFCVDFIFVIHFSFLNWRCWCFVVACLCFFDIGRSVCVVYVYCAVYLSKKWILVTI